MNYTPLPPETFSNPQPVQPDNNALKDLQEAPMVANINGKNNKPLLIGIVVVLAVVIGVLAFSILNRQKRQSQQPSPVKITTLPSIIPSPTSEIALINEITPVVEESSSSATITPDSQTKSASSSSNITPSPSQTLGTKGEHLATPTTIPTTIVSQPELPMAGTPLPILMISFLGLFILLIAFAL